MNERDTQSAGVSLFVSRVDGAHRTDQACGDAERDACNGEPSVLNDFQDLPYWIDETKPCGDNAGERHPDYLKRFMSRKTHPDNVPHLFVERVAA